MSLAFKVSPDGTVGEIQLNGNTEATLVAGEGPGHILGRENILGTVSQSGGVPTGAIIESGSNANGEYTKFADGTMICRISKIRMVYLTSDGLSVTWNYPAAFVGGNPVTVHTPDQGLIADAPNVTSLKRGAALTVSQTLSSVSLRTGAISGTYASGDFVDTSAVAHGRWY